jgi:pSer/pThr/pTyr-binding forkhead associated (FHA) protein
MTEARFFLKKVSTGEEFALTSMVSVGRSEDCAVRVVEGQPSRLHAQVTVVGDDVFIEDLASTNGTFVNDLRLEAHVKLKLSVGDRVRFDLDQFVLGTGGSAADPDLHKTQFRPPEPGSASRQSAPLTLELASDGARPPAVEPVDNAAPADAGRAERDAPAGGNALPPAWETQGKATTWMDPKKRKAAQAKAAPAAAHARGDCACFWVESGEHSAQKIPLSSNDPTKKSWSIGSADDRDVRLSETGVSAKHAVLRHENASWLLVDDMSVNGTFVNEQKTFKSYLSDGDRVRFGPIECIFRLPAPVESKRGSGGERWRQRGVIVAIAFAVTLLVLFAVFKFWK